MIKKDIQVRYKSNVGKFLAGRRVDDLARKFGVTRQMFYYYIQGVNVPHPAYMDDFLALMGEPWGRKLDKSEVWPE